jgi:hypothetical protein
MTDAMLQFQKIALSKPGLVVSVWGRTIDRLPSAKNLRLRRLKKTMDDPIDQKCSQGYI